MADWQPNPEAVAVLGLASDIIDRLALRPEDARTFAKIMDVSRLALFHGCIGPQAQALLFAEESEPDATL